MSRRIVRAFLLLAAVTLVAMPTVLPGAEPDASETWILEFRDDFQREELGNDWVSNDAAIRGGRMLVGRERPACAKIVRSFPGDVRIEFDAQAYESRPPCDLSVTLAAGRLRKMSFNYLLAFGGVYNTVNKLTGGRALTGTYDKAPTRLIEPGRVYHMLATKEGTRLSLLVDGEPLLEGIDGQIMGGPAFDAVGLVTWNGMYVDNVRVYSRATPHPDTPRYLSRLGGLPLLVDQAGRLTGPGPVPSNVKRAVEAYNRGDLPAAEAAFKAAEGEYRPAGLAYVYGNLDYDERPGDFALVSRLFAELSAASPENRRLADYAQAASWFGRMRLFPRSEHECRLLVSLGSRGNPFYDKAKLYQARFLRANGLEGHIPEVLETAATMFRELSAKAPENVTLRELTGQRVPWGRDLIETDPTVPRWAAVLHEMYVRQLAIMRWWFTQRQLPDGQLGGGWGDDVELLRSWGPFAMISDADPTVRKGIERLCQGVWDNVLRDGFAAEIGDVEHSAEPSADTLPTMLALRYGDPLWYRRNLASCRRIRDCYTGIDRRGFVRFRSGYIGGDRASDNLRHGGDTHYSARPMKHFLWSAWYGDRDARRFYLHWVRGWVEATMASRRTKPAGVPPATIWYPSGDIAPPGNIPWNDPTYNIYGYGSIGSHRLQDAFLAGYYLSRDPYFLRPLHAWMHLYQGEIPEATATDPDPAEDPSGWALRNAKHTWNCGETFAEYRWLTGDCTYDDLLGNLRFTGRLHLGRDLDTLLRQLERTLNNLRVNFNLATREVLQTDRADLPGDQAAVAAFTGAVRGFGDAGLPTMAVTWDFPHRDFAALVVYASEEHLRVWIYNFAPRAESVGIRLWQLRPGRYEVHGGLLGKGEGLDRACNWRPATNFLLRERAGVFRLNVPSRREFAVDFRLQEPIELPAVLPDPAIRASDVRLARSTQGKTDVTATAYNLGSTSVPRLTVSLIGSVEGRRRELARRTIGPLPACKQLRAGRAEVSFRAVKPAENLSVVLDPDDAVQEICESNNLGNPSAGTGPSVPKAHRGYPPGRSGR